MYSRYEKIEKCVLGHKRLFGGDDLVTVEFDNVVKVADRKTGAVSEWDISAWRVRCIAKVWGN